MGTRIVFETHSITDDNERGVATGWLPGRLSPDGRRLAVELGRRDHRLAGTPVDRLVDEEFGWQPGWEYLLA